MQYLGDYKEDETVYFLWSTNDADGASVTRTTDGTVSVYKDNGVSQSVAGITDTEDFDSLTGIHACTIDLSADVFYATGADYSVVLSAATIDGQTVNAVLAHFSIENRFMRGTDSAALASSWTAALATVLGNYTAARAGYLDELAAANLPADVDTLKTYCDILDHATNGLANIKSLIDTLDTVADAIKAVTDLLPNAGALSDLATILTDTGELQTDWADGGRLDLLIDAITTYVDLIDDATNGLAAIKAEVEGLAGAAMRGTDNAATETKQDIIDTVVDGIQTDLSNATDGLGALKTLIDALDAVLTTIKQQAAGTFNRETDSLQAIRDRGDAAWTTGAGGTAPTVEEIDTELTAEHGTGSWVGLTAIEFEED